MGKILKILIIENRDLAHAQTFCTCPRYHAYTITWVPTASCLCFILDQSRTILYESVINLSFSASNTGPKRAHERALDEECTRYRGEAFADTTRTTYKSQFRTYLRFCLYFGYNIVPCPTLTLLRYVAFLSRILSPGSISNYLNIVRLIHQQMDILSPRKRVS